VLGIGRICNGENIFGTISNAILPPCYQLCYNQSRAYSMP